jgi:hypothetical protein
MRWLAIASCAIVVLATALDAGAADRRGFGGGRAPAAAPVMAPHHFHGGTRVFVGGTFFVGPPPYYYWPGYWPGYYYPPVVAAPAAHWHYCAPLAAYYSYVPDCPGGWQLVEPYPY